MSITVVFEKIFKKSQHKFTDVQKMKTLYEQVCDLVTLSETDESWILQCVNIGDEPDGDSGTAGSTNPQSTSQANVHSPSGPSSPTPAVASAATAPSVPSRSSVSVSDVRRRVLDTAEQMIANDTRAAHCWAWVNDVFNSASAKPRKTWPTDRYVVPVPGGNMRDLPNYSAAENLQRLSRLEPGDWIFINNRNTADENGNHSVIFVDWQDQARSLARVAQLSNGSRIPPAYKTYDLVDMPLAHHSKPSPA